jgi:16S rRNA pseudouridine516 synthase
MTRLDKYLADASLGTRKHVKKAIRSGIVTVNQKTATDEGMLIDETKDQIAFQGKIIPFQQEVFILMNKPVGYMCSTIDELYPSVLNLIPEELRKRTRIVGRLDQDTTGVLLLTDDGKLNNRLIHPRLAI